jgi:hypothetical protein
MSDTPEYILRHVDHTFGELEWHEDDSCWETQIPFQGQTVSVDVYAGEGITDPSPGEQLAAIETARKYLEKLPTIEPSLRGRASGEIVQAVKSQGVNGSHPEEQISKGLELHSISLHASGMALHYRNRVSLPGWTVTIYGASDHSYSGVEVYESHGI